MTRRHLSRSATFSTKKFTLFTRFLRHNNDNADCCIIQLSDNLISLFSLSSFACNHFITIFLFNIFCDSLNFLANLLLRMEMLCKKVNEFIAFFKK